MEFEKTTEPSDLTADLKLAVLELVRERLWSYAVVFGVANITAILMAFVYVLVILPDQMATEAAMRVATSMTAVQQVVNQMADKSNEQLQELRQNLQNSEEELGQLTKEIRIAEGQISQQKQAASKLIFEADMLTRATIQATETLENVGDPEAREALEFLIKSINNEGKGTQQLLSEFHKLSVTVEQLKKEVVGLKSREWKLEVYGGSDSETGDGENRIKFKDD